MKKRSIFLTIILTIIIVVSALATFYLIEKMDNLNPLIYVALLSLVLALSFLINNVTNRVYKKKMAVMEKRLSMWNNISYRVKKAGETAFNELPIGIVVIDNDYRIMWANNHARTIFMSPLQHMNLQDASLPLYDKMKSTEPNEKGSIVFSENIYGEIYNIEYIPKYDIIYFTNVTDYENLKVQYDNRIMAIGYINVDNLEETLAEFYVQERTKYQGEIINAITEWADKFGMYVRAYSDSKYMILMDQSQLREVIKDNFTILDDVKTLFTTSRIVRITLTIGIACSDINIFDLAEEAQEQLELALNRGGDQAVVKINDKVSFFGAKTDPVQKESRVGIRNKSEELQALMQSSSSVFAIGHKNLDADGFGATLAIYRLAKSLGKKAYIVLDQDSIDSTVFKIMDTIKKEYVVLLDDIISPSKVSSYVDRNSLLMIVDCQTEYQLVDSKFIKKFDKIGIIDHHRRGAGSIENPKFYYALPSASSSVEIICGLFDFCEQPLEFNELEATILLLGMVVDTNNFIYRTSASTFEIAAKLQRYGANMNSVKAYLKEEYSEKLIRTSFIRNMEIYRNRVAIAFADDDVIHERATLAKVSDELISISGVELGITIGYIGEKEVGLSARSLGTINCQMIMEKMGGGGHLNNAAAQRKNQTIKEVIALLKEKLDSYLEEEETVKIIMIKDYKKLGKKNEILDLPAGHANFIIKSGIAIVASPENIKNLERQQAEENDRELREVEEKTEQKAIIEKTQITLHVRIGNDGKMFGSITTKQIADEIEKATGIKVEKRKITSEDSLNTVGEHIVTIELYRNVKAKLTVYIVEAE